VDMNGNLVKHWPGAFGFPNKIFPGGYLLTSTGVWPKGGSQDGMEVQIRDFNNNVVWSWNKNLEVTSLDGQGKMWISRQHHDYQIKGNPAGYYIPDFKPQDFKQGTILILSHYNVKNDKINASDMLVDDVVYEIDLATQKVLWTWKVADHFDELGFDEAAIQALQSHKAPAKQKEAGGFDWFHQNCVSYVGPNKWFDQGDKRFHPDNIILDSRGANVLAIVDRETGKIVWRAGPYYREGGDKSLQWIIGPHHTHIIPKGLPGEGNIMVYDNGCWAGYGPGNDIAPDGYLNMRRYYSRVVEFDPTTKQVVWEYSPNTLKMGWNLFGYREFSPFISAAQRLPNGNTLITEGSNGRIIEVTKELEVVWEYISPYDLWQPSLKNMVYRAYRVPYDWVPQLQKPKEVAVDPGMNHTFQIPAVDGSKPKVATDKVKGWDHGIGKQ